MRDSIVGKAAVPERYRDRSKTEDPDTEIKECVDDIWYREIGSEQLDEQIQERLRARGQKARDLYEKKMEEAESERDKVYIQGRFLYLRLGLSRENLTELADTLAPQKTKTPDDPPGASATAANGGGPTSLPPSPDPNDQAKAKQKEAGA